MSDNKNLRFAFYVSGNASRLIKIIEAYPLLIQHTFIVINDEAPNKKLAKLLKSACIEYIEYSYEEKSLKGDMKNIYTSNLLFEKFNEFNIDFSFCFGGRILKGELLNRYKNRIINFHPSVLPMFPGIKSIDKALDANTFILGNTAHFVDKGTDTGPVIMQSILQSNTFTDYEVVLSLQLPMIYQIFCWLIENRIHVEGNNVLIEKANYSQTFFYPQLEINNLK
jgi:phosphoribosylglycinamide formyltransferase-1